MSVSVSIIVPCYNVAAYLDQCMESLTGQSMEDIEIICVNDGSSDHTEEILRGWRNRDGRVRIIDQKNSGVSVARNSGMEAAVGEYIGFVDPDDMVERNMFQRLFTAAAEKDADVAVCGYHEFCDCGDVDMPESGWSPSAGFFPEEKAEQLFEKILENPDACERLKDTFYEHFPESEDMDAQMPAVSPQTFTRALFQAYQNKDLSAFLMAICGNSMFDLLRNSFLIPIRFNDKGKTNQILLTDDQGILREKLSVNVPDKVYQKFSRIYQHREPIPQMREYLAYGFREEHRYGEEDLSVESVEIGRHLGILLLYAMPEHLQEHLTDAQVYVHVWDALMRLQDVLPRAFMYYGKMQVNGQETGSEELGIFLPLRHFGDAMERNIEQADGIALGFREEMERYVRSV